MPESSSGLVHPTNPATVVAINTEARLASLEAAFRAIKAENQAIKAENQAIKELLRTAIQFSRTNDALKQEMDTIEAEKSVVGSKAKLDMIAVRLASKLTLGFRFMLPPAYDSIPSSISFKDKV